MNVRTAVRERRYGLAFPWGAGGATGAGWVAAGAGWAAGVEGVGGADLGVDVAAAGPGSCGP